MANAGRGRIGDFVRNILEEGLSYNNEYSFFIQNNSGDGELYTNLTNAFTGISNSNPYVTGTSGYENGIKMQVLCEEISLPGVSSATGTGRGINQGVDFKYAHTKLYNDLSLSFVCDRTYTPLRFFEYWFHYVYDNSETKDVYSATRSYTTKPYYDYCLNLTILKDEDKVLPPGGTQIANDKANNIPSYKSVEYALINAYPSSISSIPLNSGASQVVRFTVNLSYERWVMKANNPKLTYNSQNNDPTKDNTQGNLIWLGPKQVTP